MRTAARSDTNLDQFKSTLQLLALELESMTEKFCKDNNLSCRICKQVNDYDKKYDETVDVDFFVTVDIPYEGK